jgi:LL-diaminopimelate aminotransferase
VFPCMELNSLSKSFNMAGWRVGMLSGNTEILKNVLKVKSNVDSGMFKPVQLGAIEALQLGKAWFTALQSEYRARRIIAQQLFDMLGCKYRLGQEGMFIWAQIPSNWASGEELVKGWRFYYNRFHFWFRGTWFCSGEFMFTTSRI